MKWWLQFGCFLTGWNRRILSQCSEAWHRNKITAVGQTGDGVRKGSIAVNFRS